MADKDEIFGKVKECLVEALGVEEDDVKAEASLTGDLGAESIDFLDIVFRLEKAFNIKIPRGDLFPENILASPEFVKDGKLTPQGVAELKRRMPHADLSGFEQNPNVAELPNLFTVNMIVKYVEEKVKSPSASK
jgi:acyl carrier protein